MDQPSPIRSDAIYISYGCRAALRLAALKSPEETPNSDALAESVLMEWLKKTHPEIMEHLRERDESDKRFRDGLKPKALF